MSAIYFSPLGDERRIGLVLVGVIVIGKDDGIGS